MNSCFKVDFDAEVGISYETHKSYIENFSKSFYDSVKNLIDKNAQKEFFTDNLTNNDKILIQEIITHALFSKESVQKFHGRVNLLKKVF